jgi:hypothetical protein
MWLFNCNGPSAGDYTLPLLIILIVAIFRYYERTDLNVSDFDRSRIGSKTLPRPNTSWSAPDIFFYNRNLNI